MTLLSSSNRDLRRDNIYTWSLPAWVTHLDDGRTINTCPSAGVCAPLCYARRGTYRFSNVLNAHKRNLLMTLDTLPEWEALMLAECQRPKMTDAWVRIHDAGDFYCQEYLDAWVRIMRATPEVRYYAYTKEVAMMNALDCPPNFTFILSYGGRQDQDITTTDRRCDVFPTSEALESAGFHDQETSDLLAATGPEAVGIVVNNHPGMVKAMKGLSLKKLQEARHDQIPPT